MQDLSLNILWGLFAGAVYEGYLRGLFVGAVLSVGAIYGGYVWALFTGAIYGGCFVCGGLCSCLHRLPGVPGH